MKISMSFKQLSLVVAGLLVSVSISGFAWTGPTATPPGNNTRDLLKLDTIPQSKPANIPIPTGSLLEIGGSASADSAATWSNMTAVDQVTVQGLLAGQSGWTSGHRPVCIDNSHKMIICAPTCGNAFTEQGEQCDDGNTVSGDGCSATCQTETGGGGGGGGGGGTPPALASGSGAYPTPVQGGTNDTNIVCGASLDKVTTTGENIVFNYMYQIIVDGLPTSQPRQDTCFITVPAGQSSYENYPGKEYPEANGSNRSVHLVSQCFDAGSSTVSNPSSSGIPSC